MTPKEIATRAERVSWYDDSYYEIQLIGEDKPRYITSVTTYLKAYPKSWLPVYYGTVGNREAGIRSREAMDRGSRVNMGKDKGGHVMYEPAAWKNPSQKLVDQNNFIRTQLNAQKLGHYTLENQDEMMCLHRWEKRLEIVKPAIIGAEETLWDLELDMAGTCDVIEDIAEGSFAISGSKPIELIGGVYPNDIKTGNESKEHLLQVAGYMVLYERMTGTECAGTLVTYLEANIRTGPIPGLKTVVRNREEALEDFRKLQEVQDIWKNENPNAGPKIFDFPSVIAPYGDGQVLTGIQQDILAKQSAELIADKPGAAEVFELPTGTNGPAETAEKKPARTKKKS
jgi:CRISPR/Cas system-associated exonuclease Cas4 (RecB family)